MPDNNIELDTNGLEAPTIIGPDEKGVIIAVANGLDGLDHAVIDPQEGAPEAYPPRRVAHRRVTDLRSFSQELTRRPLTVGVGTVWASQKRGTISAVYDELPEDWQAEYTYRQDQLTLQFVEDADWRTFLNVADGQLHSQEEFGDLLEAGTHLIASHSGADLLEMVDSIRASSSGSFESRIQRATGTQTLTYSEEVSARAGSTSRPLEVPRTITFRVRRYEDYPEVDIVCWFRLRIREGKLRLALVPQPYEHLVRATWQTVVDDLSENIERPIYAANL